MIPPLPKLIAALFLVGMAVLLMSDYRYPAAAWVMAHEQVIAMLEAGLVGGWFLFMTGGSRRARPDYERHGDHD